MIKEIAIRNYQSLASVTLKLGTITVITGHTDSGKSAFIRALERAFFNDSGHTFISVFDGEMAEKCQVAIKTDDGVVVWERTKTTVKYRVVSNGKETAYTKLGRGFVPDDVVQVLGIRPIRIDTGTGGIQHQRIQLSGQFDLPFLVADRGGVAASRVLGRLTGLNVFSYANKNLTSDKSAINAELAAADAARTAKLVELSAFQGLESRKAAYAELKTRTTAAIVKQNRQTELTRLSNKQNRLNAALANVDIASVISKLEYLSTTQAVFRTLWNKLSALTRLRQISDKRVELARSIKAYVPRPVPQQPQLNHQLQRLMTLKSLARQSKELHAKTVLALQAVVKSELDIKTCEQEAAQFERDFPLCPFKDQFKSATGNYRCRDLMKVIQGNDNVADSKV